MGEQDRRVGEQEKERVREEQKKKLIGIAISELVLPLQKKRSSFI